MVHQIYIYIPHLVSLKCPLCHFLNLISFWLIEFGCWLTFLIDGDYNLVDWRWHLRKLKLRRRHVRMLRPLLMEGELIAIWLHLALDVQGPPTIHHLVNKVSHCLLACFLVIQFAASEIEWQRQLGISYRH